VAALLSSSLLDATLLVAERPFSAPASAVTNAEGSDRRRTHAVHSHADVGVRAYPPTPPTWGVDAATVLPAHSPDVAVHSL
jgi:hypothetical protein